MHEVYHPIGDMIFGTILIDGKKKRRICMSLLFPHQNRRRGVVYRYDLLDYFNTGYFKTNLSSIGISEQI